MYIGKTQTLSCNILWCLTGTEQLQSSRIAEDRTGPGNVAFGAVVLVVRQKTVLIMAKENEIKLLIGQRTC